MNSRLFLFTWPAAILIALVTITSLKHISSLKLYAPPEIVAIGTSLFRHAFPQDISEEGLFGNGQQHAYFGADRAVERQLIFYLNAAIQNGAETVFLEINPFTFDFADRDLEDDNFTLRMAAQIQIQSITSWRYLKQIVFGVPTANIDAVSSINSKHLQTIYPIKIRPARQYDQLKELISHAKHAGMRIAFVAPPRSKTSADVLGNVLQSKLIAHQKNLASQLGVPLLPISAVWPDDHFVDQAHMNRRGQQRFIQQLKRWNGGDTWHAKY